MKLWLFYTLLLPVVMALDTCTPDIAQIVTNRRQMVRPPPVKMTCLTWSSSLADTAKQYAQSCTSPPSDTFITDIRLSTDPNTDCDDVVNSWFDQSMNYFYDSDTSNGRTNEYKALANDLVNQIGCSQCSCSSMNGKSLQSPSIYTVCKFDSSRPLGKPYVRSFSSGCSSSSCPSQKPNCMSSTICCAPNLCTDKRSGCSPEDCDTNPMEALVNCAKTCNNCDGCKCYDTPNSPYSSYCPYFPYWGMCDYQNWPNPGYPGYSVCLKSCNRCDKVQRIGCSSTAVFG